MNWALSKATHLRLDNIEFRVAGMTQLSLPDGEFDAVVCVLGIFFVDDMSKLAADLWRLVRPGGWFAITTLGPRVFTPAIDELRSTISTLRPGLDVELPWERNQHPATMTPWFGEAGIDGVEVHLEANHLPLLDLGDVWRLVMGTGLRAITSELGDDM